MNHHRKRCSLVTLNSWIFAQDDFLNVCLKYYENRCLNANEWRDKQDVTCNQNDNKTVRIVLPTSKVLHDTIGCTLKWKEICKNHLPWEPLFITVYFGIKVTHQNQSHAQDFCRKKLEVSWHAFSASNEPNTVEQIILRLWEKKVTCKVDNDNFYNESLLLFLEGNRNEVPIMKRLRELFPQ